MAEARLAGLVLWALVATAPAAFGEELVGPVRGITISTHRGGQDWGSDRMAVGVAEVRAVGANWIAIHPYARIGADGSVTERGATGDAPAHLTRPVEEAKAAGLRILIKPHLAYWGSPFSWRGEVGFEDEASWNRFWRDYEAFILRVARHTRGADALVVGTELRRTEAQEDRWRALIARVRQVTDVPLTYASNWDDYGGVEFWDALDAVGIQAYFPLTGGEEPDRAALERGWSRWMVELRRFSREHDRPILFTELGYNQAYDAAERPWGYETDDAGARAVQRLCLDVALEVIERESTVLGAFLWKWFLPPRRVGRNFQLATPEMQEVIRARWRR